MILPPTNFLDVVPTLPRVLEFVGLAIAYCVCWNLAATRPRPGQLEMVLPAENALQALCSFQSALVLLS